MCFALFMIMLDNTIVNVALPSIQQELNTSPENLEWTVNAYVIAFARSSCSAASSATGSAASGSSWSAWFFTLSSAACALAHR